MAGIDMGVEGEGSAEPGKRNRVAIKVVALIVVLSALGAAVYVGWPRGGSPPSESPLSVTGLVALDSGAPAAGATIVLRAQDSAQTVQATTGTDGRFTGSMTVSLPTRVLAAATFRGPVGPGVTAFRWSPLLEAGDAVDVGRVVLPNAAANQLDLAGTTATSGDGRVVVTAVPSNVATLWASSYDPDAVPDGFPGDLAEGSTRPLNVVVVLWISALDANGQPVVALAAPATVRVSVPETQWVDAEDLQPGNGAIDTPIYSFDDATGYWVREADGRLTDAAGVPIGETSAPDIRTGTYSGAVFAEFQADHFSWWDVAKPPKDCTTDLGDADDPSYPSKLASDGARHLNPCRAWLGAWVDGESDAKLPDEDAYDDGLLARAPLKVRVSNWDWDGGLYLNVLDDKSADGDWSDAGEWVVQNLAVSVSTRKWAAVETDSTWGGDTWLRITLTGVPIQNFVGTGEFAMGETEDYSPESLAYIPAGYDSYETTSMIMAFSIPAGFFAPYSDPFSGSIVLQGKPFDPSSTADTTIRRPTDACLPGEVESKIPIEIVSLSLVGVGTIVVRYGGTNPENWDVSVGLMPGVPQPGTMTISCPSTPPNFPVESFFDIDFSIDYVVTFTEGGRIVTGVRCDGDGCARISSQTVGYRLDPTPTAGRPSFCPSCGPGGNPVETTIQGDGVNVGSWVIKSALIT